jgi:hypothetical protein
MNHRATETLRTDYPNPQSEISDLKSEIPSRSRACCRLSLAVFMWPMLLLLPGCANSVSLEDWQQRVDDFVWQEANGDPNLLREQTLGLPGSDHKGFALLGDTDVEKSTDVYGVLLGHKRFNGRPAFVFLVGVVSKQSTKDIRLAALTVENGKSAWQVSRENDAALQQYLNYRASAWKSLGAGADEAPPSLRSFPAIDDAFRLSVEAGQVTARHPASGATWTLPLTAPKVAQAPTNGGAP